ncbi:MAG TPA: hypothetical protein VK472_08865 [Allosphingosinicella sp.]|nr:hypothetical protein [Allosphingosinicella sp.]
MRDLLSKIMTGSMIAGAALLVTACGGAEDATTNNAEMNIEDPLMNDVTSVDAMNGTDANLGMDANAATTTDTTSTNTTSTDTTTTANTTDANGM